MDYRQKNTIVVTFVDGEKLDSNGSCSGSKENDLVEDLKWISYTLPSYIREKGKTMNDVVKVEIVIDYENDL